MPRVQPTASARPAPGTRARAPTPGSSRARGGLQFLVEHLTAERVRDHFTAINGGGVVRYEAANMRVLNFLLEDSLGGGGSASLKTDAQGKTTASLSCAWSSTSPRRCSTRRRPEEG